jgi:hypothetical protein
MAIATRALFLAAGAIAAALAGCGSAHIGQPIASVSTDTTPAATAKPAPSPSVISGSPSPVSVDTSGPGPQFPAALASGTATQPLTGQVELRNAWGTADGTSVVEVDAGASSADTSNGMFVILRDDRGNQSLNIITVPGTGAVWITQAPLGVSVETSAQTADLVFASDSGATGVLHLSNDTVTISALCAQGRQVDLDGSVYQGPLNQNSTLQVGVNDPVVGLMPAMRSMR